MSNQQQTSPFGQQVTPQVFPATTSAYVQPQRPSSLDSQAMRPKSELPEISQNQNPITEVKTQTQPQKLRKTKNTNPSEKNSIAPLLIFPLFIIAAMAGGVAFSDYLNFDLLEKAKETVNNAAFASNTNTLNTAGITSSNTWLKVNNSVAQASNESSTEGRIPLGLEASLDDEAIVDFDVVFDQGEYKLWYAASSSTQSNVNIYYATSVDGINWEKQNQASDGSTKAQIELGEAGSGDENMIYSPSVLVDGAEYKMYYVGKALDGTTGVYLATSTDGLTWTKVNNTLHDKSDSLSTEGRIPLGLSQSGDDTAILDVHVFKNSLGYVAWYSAINSQDLKSNIFYATSTDGLSWSKFNNAMPTASDTSSAGVLPIGTQNTQDSNSVSDVEIFGSESLGYTMFYTASSVDESRKVNTAILCSVSTDGINWFKTDNSFSSSYDLSRKCSLAPSVDETQKGDSLGVLSPELVAVNGKIKLMYIGQNSDTTGIYTAVPL